MYRTTFSRRALLSLCAAAAVQGAHAMPLTTRLQPASEFQWRYLADTVMGGVSRGGAEREGDAIRLSGTVSTANRGGFIQVRTELESPLPDSAAGLVLRVRGNGERYFLHLRTRATRLPWQYYQAGFPTGEDWSEVRVPFDGFAASGRLLPAHPAPGSVRSIGLVAYGRDHAADVSLAALGIY